MTKQSHTPGPWFIQDKFLNLYALSDGTVGLTMFIAKFGGEQLPGSVSEAKANLRLAAAAPDLLEALLGIKHIAEDFISDWAADTQEGGKGDPFDVAHWHKVLNAITKATGEA